MHLSQRYPYLPHNSSRKPLPSWRCRLGTTSDKIGQIWLWSEEQVRVSRSCSDRSFRWIPANRCIEHFMYEKIEEICNWDTTCNLESCKKSSKVTFFSHYYKTWEPIKIYTERCRVCFKILFLVLSGSLPLSWRVQKAGITYSSINFQQKNN